MKGEYYETKGQLYEREVARLKSVMESRERAPVRFEIRNRFLDYFLLGSHNILKHLPYDFKVKVHKMISGIFK